MRLVFSSVAAFLLFNFSAAQAPQENDPKAKTILDDLSKTTKAYKTITADYSFTIVNKDKKQVEKQDGKIMVKGSKFHLEIPGNTIVGDGKKVFNHNKDAQEVSIKCFEPNEDDMLDPTKIFTMYEKGFKFKFEKEEKTETGMVLQVINLYPTVKPEKKKYHTAKIYIDKAKKQIRMMKLIMKDGGTWTYEIKKFTPNVDLPESNFTFDLSKFKADQIVNECEEDSK
jgi:outer membrane lipoprotein carrier protein